MEQTNKLAANENVACQQNACNIAIQQADK